MQGVKSVSNFLFFCLSFSIVDVRIFCALVLGGRIFTCAARSGNIVLFASLVCCTTYAHTTCSKTDAWEWSWVKIWLLLSTVLIRAQMCALVDFTCSFRASRTRNGTCWTDDGHSDHASFQIDWSLSPMLLRRRGAQTSGRDFRDAWQVRGTQAVSASWNSDRRLSSACTAVRVFGEVSLYSTCYCWCY